MKQLKERWIIIPMFPDYEASNKQRVRKISNSKIISQHINGKGYWQLSLCKNGKFMSQVAHRMIAMAWVPNSQNKPCINHDNGIKTDNRPINLKWCTQKENVHHAYLNGLSKGRPGTEKQRLAVKAAKNVPVFSIDIKTGRQRRHQSLTICGTNFGVSQTAISHAIKRGSTVQKKYKISFKSIQI